MMSSYLWLILSTRKTWFGQKEAEAVMILGILRVRAFYIFLSLLCMRTNYKVWSHGGFTLHATLLYGPIISLAGRFWAVLFCNLLLVIGLPRALGFFRRLCTVGGLSVAFF
jgi:hypothetical protein